MYIYCMYYIAGVTENIYSLFPETRPFLLELWKFLHTSLLQREHGITDRMVEELTPLPIPVGEREDGKSVAEEKLVKRIKVDLVFQSNFRYKQQEI